MKTELRSKIGGVALFVAISAFSMLSSESAMGGQLDVGSVQTVSGGFTLPIGATVGYTVVGTAITVDFGPGVYPPTGPVLATISVDNGVPNSAFKGNLIDRAVNKLRFEITDSGCRPLEAVLQMQCAAPEQSRVWKAFFTTLGQSGTKKVVEIPLLRVAWTNEWPGDPDKMFAQDIQYVTSLSITLCPGQSGGAGATPAQSYKIENFVAVNDDGISSPPATLTPLEKALISRFGYGYGSVDKLTAGMKAWDADGDGMADYVEIQAENDEAFANSIFAAHDVKITAEGAQITWTTVKGQAYTVLITDELGKEFAAVTALNGVQATNTGFTTQTDTSVKGKPGPFFYKILRH